MKTILRIAGALAAGFGIGCLAMHCQHLQAENDALTDILNDDCCGLCCDGFDPCDACDGCDGCVSCPPADDEKSANAAAADSDAVKTNDAVAPCGGVCAEEDFPV